MKATERVPGKFLYLAWNVHLRLIGPFVAPSSARHRTLGSLQSGLTRLESIPGMGSVRLLESTFVAPLPGAPRFDVALLINGSDEAIAAARGLLAALDIGEPSLITSASNVQRFGDTDSSDGPILLNHFTSASSPEDVASVWSGISDWYGQVLGVDNSTLLAFEDPCGYVVMNYASIPGPVVRFMAGQLLRPSFRSQVIAPLKTVDARALPVFARRVHPSVK